VLPERCEVVRGILVRKAMPTFEHGYLQGRLHVRLDPHAQPRGRWWFGSEVEVEFSGAERYLPGLAGWDSERVAERPRGARVPVAPQWVCEILSPSTAHLDLGDKRETYHAAHVAHYWLLDPEARTLTVLEWADDGYRTVLTAGAGERVKAVPFDTAELDELFA